MTELEKLTEEKTKLTETLDFIGAMSEEKREECAVVTWKYVIDKRVVWVDDRIEELNNDVPDIQMADKFTKVEALENE